MGRLLTNILLILCCLWLPAGAWAEIQRNEIIGTLTIENGLAGESVCRIMTDHLGQVWIATSNGVNRYNGRKLLTYRLPKPSGLSSYVFDICESDDHAIYAASNTGLYRLREGHSSFENVAAKGVSTECVTKGKGCVYFGNKDGLNIYDGKQVRTVSLGRGVNFLVRDIVVDGKGIVWFLTKYELNSYNPATGKTQTFPISKSMSSGAAFGQLVVLGHRFYIGTKNNGLWSYDMVDKKVVPVAGVGNVITNLDVTHDGLITVGCDGAGAFLLNGSTGTVLERFSIHGDMQHSLPTDAVYCYYRDANRVNWMGFFRRGMQYTYHSSHFFHIYKYGDFTTEGMEIKSVLKHGKELVFGTSNGLYYIDQGRNLVKKFSSEDLGGAHIITRLAYFQGKYYIASYDGGLRVLDPRRLSVSRLGLDPLLDNTSVSALAVSPKNRLWIGSSEGLYILDSQGTLMRYTENNAKIYGGAVNDVFFDNAGHAWLSGPHGMSLYSESTKFFTNVDFPKGFFNQESVRKGVNGHGNSLYFTAHNGIFYTDPQMIHFGTLRLPEGLLEENSYGFLDDRAGHYWIATESGLFSMDYSLSNMQHFGYGEGLPSQIVNAMDQDSEGNVWFSTANGLLYVNPKSLFRMQSDPYYKVLLYDIYRGEDLVDAGAESKVNDRRAVSLRWNLGSEKLAFKIVMEDFARPYGRLYEYRVDGSKKWTIVKDGVGVTIADLQLGTHELKVRKAGVPGSEKTYTITVYPTLWAVIEFILLIAVFVLLALWRNYRKDTKALLVERKEIEQALIEVEQEQQRNEEQSELALTDDSKKYERVRLDEKECEEIMSRLRDYIEKNKPYLNCDYKMSELAETLRVSPSKLSQVFNVYQNENYYEFINRYRLAEFKKMIAAGEYKRYTLTALSEKCGFKRSNFFSTFRKVEGMTPTEYLKKQNITL
ncbi:MAG: helix-turn-helix domain-containing protein [Prevotella sp.]|nr:helix-turn-helix domain-containing protein [Prevotella sp.]